MRVDRLLAWFRKMRRPMPWRLAPAPYGCWLSEIMLQQTTYEQALPYWERFLARFPDVAALAAASEADVLKQWEGLGYYARARNLHAAAKRIAANGWPHSAVAWLALPGVGPYTAAALASVLDGEKTPVVDGNVARVFARVWLLEDDFKKQPARARLAAKLKAELFGARVKPGDVNQAVMELGALVCTPAAPQCGACPLAGVCRAREKGVQTDYPRRAPRKPLPVRKRLACLIRDAEGRVLLERIEEGGLLKGLWRLPEMAPSFAVEQTFSHFKLDLSVCAAASGTVRFVFPRDVPLTTATRKALERAAGSSVV